MMNNRFAAFSFALATVICAFGMREVRAASFLDDDAEAALKALYSTSAAAKALGETAEGILVFPVITRAGFLVGVHGGEGVLFRNGKPVAHYSAGGASVGLQAGVQSYSYAMFFMTKPDLAYLDRSGGWSLGTGPTLVVADTGVAGDLSTLTARKGIYTFIFGQTRLMAGLGVNGQQISRIR